MVTAMDCNGQKYCWNATVDPFTREVTWAKEIIEDIKAVLNRFNTWVFHNITFDLRALHYIDPWFSAMAKSKTLHCTMVRAKMLDSKGPGGLKELGLLHLDILDDDESDLDLAIKALRHEVKKLGWKIAEEGLEELAGSKSKFHKMDMWIPETYARVMKLPKNPIYWTVAKRYAIMDAKRTAGLFLVQENTFEQIPSLYAPYQIQQNIFFPIYDIERHGISLIEDKFKREFTEANVLRGSLIATMQQIVENNFDLLDFNPDSPKQLRAVLFDHFSFLPEKMGKAEPSTDKTVLPKLLTQKNTFAARTFVDTLIQYREVTSAVRYLHSYDRFRLGWKLYPNINIVGTSTTRLSSSNPNGQNIGKGKEVLDEEGNLVEIKYSIRRVFGPEKNRFWVTIDYDQLQLRIFSFWSKEQTLIDAINAGFDFHDTVAKFLFGVEKPSKAQRKVAKYCNFGIIFGAGPSKIDSMCGIPGTHKRVLKLFPNVAESISTTVDFVRKHGYVETASGYRLVVPKNKAYAGVNYIVQGTEGDIVKKALYDSYTILEDFNYELSLSQEQDAKCILQVHDELIFSLYKSKKLLKPTNTLLQKVTTAMEEAGTYFGVPCKCKPELIINNWAEATSIDVKKGLTWHGVTNLLQAT